MDETQPKNHHYLLIGFSLVLLLIAGAFFWQNFLEKKIFSYKAHNKQAYEQKLKEANSAHDSGDYAKAVDYYSQLLGDTTNPLSKVKIKAKLANDIVHGVFTDVDSVTRAIAIQKSIISDPSVDSPSKALVLNEMANLIKEANVSSLFIQKNFSEDIYTTLPSILSIESTDSNEDISRDFAIRLHEYSDKIYPNAFAKLAIAYYLSGYIYHASLNKAITDTEIKTIQDKMKKYLNDSQPLLTGLEYEPPQIVKMYLRRAIATQSLYTRTKQTSYEEVKKNYEDAISVGAKYNDSFSVSNTVLAVIYYGYFVDSTKKGTSGEVQNILQKIFDNPLKNDQVVKNMILNRVSLDGYERRAILGLAVGYPNFKKYLEDIGWKLK